MDTSSRVPRNPALPTFEAARCVHGLCPVATCEACVAACPRSAIECTDDGLELDIEACDGCGLCVPACPEAARSSACRAVFTKIPNVPFNWVLKPVVPDTILAWTRSP